MTVNAHQMMVLLSCLLALGFLGSVFSGTVWGFVGDSLAAELWGRYQLQDWNPRIPHSSVSGQTQWPNSTGGATYAEPELRYINKQTKPQCPCVQRHALILICCSTELFTPVDKDVSIRSQSGYLFKTASSAKPITDHKTKAGMWSPCGFID